MRIISIDPGYERLGIAVLEKNNGQKEKVVFSDTIQTSSKKEFRERLFEIGKEFENILKKYAPKVLAIENLFFNTNQKTVINVSEMRGALIFSALKNGLQVFEYTPLQIKAAITGYGKADKNQVIFMIQKLVDIEKEIKYDDEYDAIACGLTFFASDLKEVKNLI